MNVAWTASTDNVGVAGYRVSRDGIAIGTLPVGSTSFSDTGRDGSTTYAYTVAALDGAGNLSAASGPAAPATTPAPPFTTITYSHDLADRLTGIAAAGSPAVSFTLDALGRHASRSQGGVVSDTYAYLGTSTTVVRDTSAADTLDAVLDASGARLASATASGAFGWLLADLHGNVAGASDGASVTDAFRYDAWGRTSAAVTSALPSPWRYGGRLLESGAGSPDLYDFGARSYAPDLGAFISLDTVTGSALDPASLNRFLDANANPATLVDPDGHMALRTDDGGGLGTPVVVVPKKTTVVAAKKTPTLIATPKRPTTTANSVPKAPVPVLPRGTTSSATTAAGDATSTSSATGKLSPREIAHLAWELENLELTRCSGAFCYQLWSGNPFQGIDPGSDLYAWLFGDPNVFTDPDHPYLIAEISPKGAIPLAGLQERGINPSLGGPGTFIAKTENMNPAPLLYQVRATGTAEGYVYRVSANGATWYADGFGNLLSRPGQGLIEAKGNYEHLFQPWNAGNLRTLELETSRSMVRQVAAANGVPIEYRVASQAATEFFQRVVVERGLQRYITVVHVP